MSSSHHAVRLWFQCNPQTAASFIFQAITDYIPVTTDTVDQHALHSDHSCRTCSSKSETFAGLCKTLSSRFSDRSADLVWMINSAPISVILGDFSAMSQYLKKVHTTIFYQFLNIKNM